MREIFTTFDSKQNKTKKTKRSKKYRKNSSETNLNEITNEKQMVNFLYNKNEPKTQSAFHIENEPSKDKRKKNAETFYQTMKRPRNNPYSRSYSSYRVFTAPTLNDSLLDTTQDSMQSSTSNTNLDESKSKSVTNLYDDTFNEYDCSQDSIYNEKSIVHDTSIDVNQDELLLQPLQQKITSSLSDIRTLSLESLKSENQQYLETPPKRRKYKTKSDYPLDNSTSPKPKISSETGVVKSGKTSPIDILRSKQKENMKSKKQHKRHVSEQSAVRMRHNKHAAFPEGKNGDKRLSLQDQPKSSRSKKVHRSTTLYWESTNSDEGNVDNLVLNVSMGARIQSRFIDTILHSAATNGQLDIVKFYVDKDKYLNEQNGYLNTALHCATYHKHTDIIDVLLQYNIDLNLQNVEGDTVLHLACDQELTEVVQKFIKKGSHLNIQNENGESPLHIAVHRKKLDIVKMLVDANADTTIKNHQGNTPLHSAIHYFATKDTIKLLMDKMEERRIKQILGSTVENNNNTGKDISSNFNISAPSISIEIDDVDMVKIDEIDSGTEADFDSQSVIGYDDEEFCVVDYDSKHGVTVTDVTDGLRHSQSKQQRKEATQEFEDFEEFSKGVNGSSELNQNQSIETDIKGTKEEIFKDEDTMNIRNNSGDTLLLRAVKYCGTDIVDMILNCSNIDLNVINMKGNSILHCAAILPTSDTMELLLKKECGNLLNIKNGLGNTPLHCSTERGNISTMKHLLELGADSSLKNLAGNTPSHCAVLTNQFDCMKLLLQYNAEVNLFNNDGNLPIHCATVNANLDILNLLIDAEESNTEPNELDISTKNGNGDSLIHLIVKSNHPEDIKIPLLQFILDHSADVNSIDNEGNTILHLTLNNNQDKIVKLFLTHREIKYNIQNNNGDTVLHLIAQDNLMDILSEINASSKDLSIKNMDGLTPLNIALQRCYGDMAMVLLNMAWDLDFKM